jgi:hypothetical protein
MLHPQDIRPSVLLSISWLSPGPRKNFAHAKFEKLGRSCVPKGAPRLCSHICTRLIDTAMTLTACTKCVECRAAPADRFHPSTGRYRSFRRDAMACCTDCHRRAAAALLDRNVGAVPPAGQPHAHLAAGATAAPGGQRGGAVRVAEPSPGRRCDPDLVVIVRPRVVRARDCVDHKQQALR